VSGLAIVQGLTPFRSAPDPLLAALLGEPRQARQCDQEAPHLHQPDRPGRIPGPAERVLDSHWPRTRTGSRSTPTSVRMASTSPTPIRLDRLFTRLGEEATGATSGDEVMVGITRLAPAERPEARARRLIRTRAQALGTDANRRIRSALESPTHAEYTRGLNPRNSPRISVLSRRALAPTPSTCEATTTGFPRPNAVMST
jgi:hypothetical protein